MILEYPKNVRFKCMKCGLCCGDTHEKKRNILLLKKEAHDIAAATNMPISDFATEKADTSPYCYEMKKTATEGRCFFLSENRCAIYLKRPLICRFYPFGLQTDQNTREIFYFTDECPGIGKGKIIKETDFQQLLKQAKKRMMANRGNNELEA